MRATMEAFQAISRKPVIFFSLDFFKSLFYLIQFGISFILFLHVVFINNMFYLHLCTYTYKESQRIRVFTARLRADVLSTIK